MKLKDLSKKMEEINSKLDYIELYAEDREIRVSVDYISFLDELPKLREEIDYILNLELWKLENIMCDKK